MSNPYELILRLTCFSPKKNGRASEKTLAEMHFDALEANLGSLSWRVEKILELEPDFPKAKITQRAIKGLEFAFRAHGDSEDDSTRRFVLECVEKAIAHAWVTWDMLSFNRNQLRI